MRLEGYITPAVSLSSHARSARFERISVQAIARELGLPTTVARRLLARMAWIGLTPNRIRGVQPPPTYPVEALEVLKALLNHPHRHVTAPGDDWLTAWLTKESTDGTTESTQRRA